MRSQSLEIRSCYIVPAKLCFSDTFFVHFGEVGSSSSLSANELEQRFRKKGSLQLAILFCWRWQPLLVFGWSLHPRRFFSLFIIFRFWGSTMKHVVDCGEAEEGIEWAEGKAGRGKKIFQSCQLLSLHNKISRCQLHPFIHIGHIWPQHYYPLMVYFCEICGSGTYIKQGVSSHLAQSTTCCGMFNWKYQDLQDIEPTLEFSWDPDDLASEIPTFDAPDMPAQSYHTTVEILDEDSLLPVCWIEDFPGPARSILAPCTSTFHNQRKWQKEAGHAPCVMIFLLTHIYTVMRSIPQSILSQPNLILTHPLVPPDLCLFLLDYMTPAYSLLMTHWYLYKL